MLGRPFGILLLGVWCIYRGVKTFVPGLAQLEPIMSAVVAIAGLLLIIGV